MVTNNILSDRYKNDDMSLNILNDIQNQHIAGFVNDKRIQFVSINDCPLCSHTKSILIAEKDRYGIPLDTVVCAKCGLVYSKMRMDSSSASIFYSEYYRRIYEGIESPVADYYKPMYDTATKGKIPKFLNKNDIVVEIGAGGGWNLIKYKNNGYDHYGFDLDANLINFGREKYKLNLLPGGIEEAKKLGLKADYVLLLHVLEHTEDPLNLLVSLKDILSDNAVLQIGVPSLNMLIFGGSTVGKSLIETLQLAHNFLFDEFTLRFFLLKAGYKIHVCFGETIIVKKEEAQKSRRLLESMDRYISDSHRGYKIVKYLKLCEFFNVKRRKILPNFVDNNFHYLYYTKKPVQFFKLMLIFKYGIFI